MCDSLNYVEVPNTNIFPKKSNHIFWRVSQIPYSQFSCSLTSFMLMSAPHFTNSFATSTRPLWAALWRGVFEMIGKYFQNKGWISNELSFNCNSHFQTTNQKHGINSQLNNKQNTQNLTFCVIVQNAFAQRSINGKSITKKEKKNEKFSNWEIDERNPYCIVLKSICYWQNKTMIS